MATQSFHLTRNKKTNPRDLTLDLRMYHVRRFGWEHYSYGHSSHNYNSETFIHASTTYTTLLPTLKCQANQNVLSHNIGSASKISTMASPNCSTLILKGSTWAWARVRGRGGIIVYGKSERWPHHKSGSHVCVGPLVKSFDMQNL